METYVILTSSQRKHFTTQAISQPSLARFQPSSRQTARKLHGRAATPCWAASMSWISLKRQTGRRLSAQP